MEEVEVESGDGVELPKRTRRKLQVLGEEQARKSLETAREDTHGVVFTFAVAT
jgi:hypothetical protein